MTDKEKNEEQNIVAYNEAINRLKKAWKDVGQAIVDGLNGKHTYVEEKPKIDRCEGCIHRSEYRDMGATTPICRKGYDLVEAAKMRVEQSPCKLKVTWAEVNEYTKRKEKRNDR